MDAIVLLTGFIAGTGSFTAGVVAASILLKPKDETPIAPNYQGLEPFIRATPPVKKVIHTKPPEKAGPITRPNAEKLDKKAHPRQAEEEDEMGKAFDALINSPHSNTMMMQTHR